jgi:hypothetical protein
MKVVKLHLHLTPAEAMQLLEFIDQLREALLDQYGEPIQQMMRDELEERSNQI